MGLAWPGLMEAASGATASQATSPAILVLNAGSSTLKASVVAVVDPTGSPASRPGSERLAAAARNPSPPRAAHEVDWGDDASRSASVVAAVDSVLRGLEDRGVRPEELAAVAHRVVHGGPTLREPRLIDERVLGTIESLAPLAPLHNPVAAAAIRAARGLLPAAPHFAVFDTAFHATLPEPAWRYPLPSDWEAWEIRRYGFHGLSVAWSVARTGCLLERPVPDLGLVVAHLGSGCSVTAVAAGRSVSTSMGMTPLEGLMMGTRAGSIDPGILLAVLRDGRRSPAELAEDLDHRAGLLGVSRRSAGARELAAAADAGDRRAALALEMFADRAAAGIAAAATALPQLDGVVFTAGIGEHAGALRSTIVARLGVLGIAEIGAAESGEDRILSAGRGPAVLRVEAREDIVAACAALDVLGSRA